MGDAYKDEFTAEELEALGEVEPKVKEPETKEPENPVSPENQDEPKNQETETEQKNEPNPAELTEEEKKQAEETGLRLEKDEKGRTYLIDEDGAKIPVKRWKEHYSEAAQTKRELEELKEKQTLFKQLGPDGYYRLYPDEAPEGYKPAEPASKAPAAQNVVEILNLQVTGGKYDGYSLRELMQEDPETAAQLLSDWKTNQEEEFKKQQETELQSKQDQATEAFNFGMARAQELWGITDANQLTPEHNRKIVLLGQEVLAWQRANNRGNLSWEDAYYLMTRDTREKKLVEDATAKALKSLQKNGPASIDTGAGGEVKADGWDVIANMSERELTRHIDRLDDRAFAKFCKEAPASIRAKHPGIPWD